jgi:hypothetical protein
MARNEIDRHDSGIPKAGKQHQQGGHQGGAEPVAPPMS